MKKNLATLTLGVLGVLSGCNSHQKSQPRYDLEIAPAHATTTSIPIEMAQEDYTPSKRNEERDEFSSKYTLEKGAKFPMVIGKAIEQGTVRVKENGGRTSFLGGVYTTQKDLEEAYMKADKNNDNRISFSEAESYLAEEILRTKKD